MRDPSGSDQQVKARPSRSERPGVWAVTLWTADRAPILVGLEAHGVGLSELGRIVEDRWRAIEQRFAGVTCGELAILPDRVRGIVYIPRGEPPDVVEPLVEWLKASVSDLALARGALGPASTVWDASFDAELLTGADELTLWRRRIRAGQAGWRRGGCC
jgi:hypothetical protein